MRILILLAALALTSCTGLSEPASPIDAAEIEPLVLDVARRHDEYVILDTTLTELQVETYLRSTEILRMVLDAAQDDAPDER